MRSDRREFWEWLWLLTCCLVLLAFVRDYIEVGKFFWKRVHVRYPAVATAVESLVPGGCTPAKDVSTCPPMDR